MIMMLNSAITSVTVTSRERVAFSWTISPLVFSPEIGWRRADMSRRVVLPVVTQSAKTFATQLVVVDWESDQGVTGGSHVEPTLTDFDFVILVHLSQTCLRLLATHLDSNLGVFGFVRVWSVGNVVFFLVGGFTVWAPRSSFFEIVVVAIVTDDSALVDVTEILFTLKKSIKLLTLTTPHMLYF